MARTEQAVSRRYRVKRRDSGPGRGTQGRVADAGYPDDGGYPEDVYLDASAYPVDPGYRAHSGSRPRPADMPAGPPPSGYPASATRPCVPRPGPLSRRFTQYLLDTACSVRAAAGRLA